MFVIFFCMFLSMFIPYLWVFQEKRLRFPRFYFLGDEDLLEILGQANKQHVIQSHLKKLFSGIHSVVFR